MISRFAALTLAVAPFGLVTAALATAAQAATPVTQRCNADLVCVEVYKGEQIRLALTSTSSKPLSFRLFLSANLKHLDPTVVLLDGHRTLDLVSFPATGDPWGFEYRIHYAHKAHRHDEDHVYALPYAAGATYVVTQSHTNLSTHHLGNRYAIDWGMPVGEPVHAARSGKVVSTFGSASGNNATGSATANHIWIRHSDGTIGKYLHLAHGGVAVAEGDSVVAGQMIGTSGNTGYSRGAHLHFSVSTLGGDALYKTFNLTFDTHSGPRQLVSGESYRHAGQRRSVDRNRNPARAEILATEPTATPPAAPQSLSGAL
jgi:murein DD-endopeptidase MepM/ murein hydrolase activator NlpD